MGQEKRTEKHQKAAAMRTVEDRLDRKPGALDHAIVLSEAAAITLMISYGFFDSFYALLLFFPAYIINMKRYMKLQNEKRHNRIRQEFKELLSSVSSLLQTGYSVENAFAGSKDVLSNLYGSKSILYSDLKEMNRQIDMKMPVEKALMELIKKYPLEELESFGEIFLYTRRLGGGYVKNLRDTAERIEGRINMRSELDTMISQKKLELYIMSVMPMAIILYMRVTADGFLDPMYHNLGGIFMMAGALAVYVGSVILGMTMITRVKNSI